MGRKQFHTTFTWKCSHTSIRCKHCDSHSSNFCTTNANLNKSLRVAAENAVSFTALFSKDMTYKSIHNKFELVYN